MATTESAGPAWAAATYQPGLPDNIGPFRGLLENYSNIPSDEVDDHLLEVRDKAWAVAKFPCIGKWSFTNLSSMEEPLFQRVVARLKAPGSNDAFLDVPCCLGQVVRQLAAEGVDPSKLYGADLAQEFLDLGFELFRDRDRFPDGVFVAADLLDTDDAKTASLRGKVTLIHVLNFFHLFGWDEQVVAAARIVSFLKPDAEEPVIFGGQIGCKDPKQAAFKSLRNGGERYLHTPASLQKLWDEVGEKTACKWRVEADWVSKMPFRIPGFPEQTWYLKFAVFRE